MSAVDKIEPKKHDMRGWHRKGQKSTSSEGTKQWAVRRKMLERQYILVSPCPWGKPGTMRTGNSAKCLYMSLALAEHKGFVSLERSDDLCTGFYGIKTVTVVNHEEFNVKGFFPHPRQFESNTAGYFTDRKTLVKQWRICGFEEKDGNTMSFDSNNREGIHSQFVAARRKQDSTLRRLGDGDFGVVNSTVVLPPLKARSDAVKLPPIASLSFTMPGKA